MLDGYKKLPNGVIKQDGFFQEKIKYDDNYIQTYEGFGEIGVRMSHLRYGYIIGSIGNHPDSLLDVGYGNGDFLKVATQTIPNCYGTDISGYPTPEGVEFIEWNKVFDKHFDVITFFDALEHFEDNSFVKDLKCDYVVVSLPYCHYFSDEWFKNWKHRKPDEHLWFYDAGALSTFMLEMGFLTINLTTIEDIIRKPVDEYSNILTGVFRKI